MRKRAIRKLLKDRPALLIGSSMCTAYRSMSNINYFRMCREEVHERLRYARKHLEFCRQLYRIQMNEGRYLLREHPSIAKSWREKAVQQLLTETTVNRVVGDQCRYGLQSKVGGIIGPQVP